MSFTMSMGGSGGEGGDGKTVNVNSSNTIITKGVFAHGILAQSVGGGGGAGGDARSFQIDLSANPTDFSPFADLISFDSTLVLGGNGGKGGSGGNVTVTNSGNIATQGAFAHGIVAQSVGGGGGAGGNALTFEFSNTDVIPVDQIPVLSDITNLTNPSMFLHGGAGAAGNGGNVTVTNSGNIATQGAFAHGIVAQSVGGGGGLAGISNPQGATSTTFGPNAHGILTQGAGLGVSFAGSVGGNGSGGNVTVVHSGNINTLGYGSHGIFAQSAGGLLSGGAVNVTLNGNITAQGVDSDGILAQSVGGTGGNNIAINIISGTVQGGSGSGAAVKFLDGKDNTLDNRAAISALSGNAIIGGDGNETINNYGIVTGSVGLGAGRNVFNNNAAAIFNSGAAVDLGAGNTFTNAGTLSPGGSRAPLTTVLNGNLVQTSSGTFEAEVYGDGRHDQVQVNGGSASLDGTLLVMRGQGPYINGTRYNIIEVTGTQGISGAFSNFLLPEPKPLLRFGVNQLPNIVEVEVYAQKYTTVATNRVEQAIGNYLDRIMPTATGDLLNVLGEFQSLSLSQFGTAFSSLSPDSYDNFTRTTYANTHQHTKSLQYRMNNVRSYLQAHESGNETPILLAYRGSDAGQLYNLERVSQIQGKNGLWFDAFGQWGNQGEENRYHWNGGYTGYDYFMRGATLGFDHNLSDKFMAGASLGYSRSDIDLDHDQGSGYIKSLYGSIYGSYFHKNLYIDGAFSYGRNWYNNHRLITIGTIHQKAYSEHDGDLFSAYLQGGYYFDIKKWLIGPFASLQYIYLDEESFNEKGAGGVSLRVDGRKTDSLVSELGVRLARVFKTKCGSLIPEVSAAWLHDFDIDDRVITSSFAGSPGASFSIRGQDVERNGATLGAGITFIHKSGLSTSLKYIGEFREKYRSNGVMGEIRYTF
jgi:uncharacterized protein with beta-barrel porin domain